MQQDDLTNRAIALPSESDRRLTRPLYRLVRPSLERLLRIDELNEVYDRAVEHGDPAHTPFDRILEAHETDWEPVVGSLELIPREGPLVVVANHPFGGIEGLLLGSILRRVRPDVKLLANFLLHTIPILRDSFFFVDPFDRPESARKNVGSIRAAVRWVEEGHVLGVFPAGEVSHATIRRPRVVDPAWSHTVARIARRAKAPVLPIFFDGRNSLSFQLLGLVHPRIRTIMLPNEFLKRKRSTIRIGIGQPIPARRVAGHESDRRLVSHLRARTYLLKGRIARVTGAAGERTTPAPAPEAPVAAAADPSRIAREIEGLPADRTLGSAGDLRVVHARAGELTETMPELGRLRELAFRGVGEGTGRASDTDRFDETYVHLLLWNDREHELVGGYRLGPTDEILPREGVEGLYTHTLFKYGDRLIGEIDPALEMGRSFVRPEYQRSYQPLVLLWRGIGGYVCKHPRYRMLFGPVSISNAYGSMSKELLMAFLRTHRYLEPLGRLIRPRHPVPDSPRQLDDEELEAIVAGGLEDVDEIIRELEDDRRAMPVLLRQYLKLDAKLLGFNVDPDFGDVVDGLMLVDLLDVDRRVLRHYMGAEEAEAFRAWHGCADRA